MKIDIKHYVKRYNLLGPYLPRADDLEVITYLERFGFNFKRFSNTYKLQKQELLDSIIGQGATTYILEKPTNSDRVLGITVDPSKIHYLYNTGLLYRIESYGRDIWVYEMDKLKPVSMDIGMFLVDTLEHKKALTSRVVFNKELLDDTLKKFGKSAVKDLHSMQFMYNPSNSTYVCVDPVLYKGIDFRYDCTWE